MTNHFIFAQYGDGELYYRIVNMKDAEIQSLTQISANNHNQYTAPQVSLHLFILLTTNGTSI